MADSADSWRLPRRLVAVVDADVILANAAHQAKYGITPRLVLATRDGTVRLLASDHVYFEVYERMTEVATDMGVEPEEMKAVFEDEHLPLIRFACVPNELPSSARSFEIVDKRDRPTGYLAELVAPCVVFSRDRHLKKPGLAPEDWLSVAKAAVDAGERDRRERAMGMVALGPPAGVFLLLRWASLRLGLPGWLVAFVVTGLSWNLLRDPNRRVQLGRGLGAIVDAIMLVLEEGRQLQEAGLEQLRVAGISRPEPPMPEQLVAGVLAWADEPLLAAEIAELAIGEGQGDVSLTIEDVRAALNSCGAFIRRQHSRYELGRFAGPLR